MALLALAVACDVPEPGFRRVAGRGVHAREGTDEPAGGDEGAGAGRGVRAREGTDEPAGGDEGAGAGRDAERDRDDEGEREGAGAGAARERRACVAGAPREIAAEPGGAVAVAATDDVRLVVVDPGAGGFVALVPTPGAATARRELPRARGEELLALEPAGDRFVLVGLAPCAHAGVATQCLVARAIAAEGEIEVGPPVEAALPAPLRSLRVHATRTLLYVARSHASAPPGLERFEVGTNGTITHTRRALGESLPEGEPVEILGLTADGAGWAVLYRHGATEDARSGVVLATQLDEHEVGEMHDALLVESMAWVGSSLAMIVAFEFARPSWVRLGADGEVVTAPRALPPGGEPPLPFAGRRTARVVGEAGARAVEVRDAMGDRVGSRLVLGEGYADVAPAEDGFVAALHAPGGEVRLFDVTCP